MQKYTLFLYVVINDKGRDCWPIVIDVTDEVRSNIYVLVLSSYLCVLTYVFGPFSSPLIMKSMDTFLVFISRSFVI